MSVEKKTHPLMDKDYWYTNSDIKNIIAATRLSETKTPNFQEILVTANAHEITANTTKIDTNEKGIYICIIPAKQSEKFTPFTEFTPKEIATLRNLLSKDEKKIYVPYKPAKLLGGTPRYKLSPLTK